MILFFAQLEFEDIRSFSRSPVLKTNLMNCKFHFRKFTSIEIITNVFHIVLVCLSLYVKIRGVNLNVKENKRMKTKDIKKWINKIKRKFLYRVRVIPRKRQTNQLYTKRRPLNNFFYSWIFFTNFLSLWKLLLYKRRKGISEFQTRLDAFSINITHKKNQPRQRRRPDGTPILDIFFQLCFWMSPHLLALPSAQHFLFLAQFSDVCSTFIFFFLWFIELHRHTL